MATSLENTQLGRYRVIAKIGSGAMGVVYRGTDPLLEREVAIKTIRIDVSASEREEFKRRFFREAKSAARLNHPNIVTVFDAGEADDVAYIAMELLDGQDLRHFLTPENRLTLERCAAVVADVANALDYAHREGVIHRDVKPGNIVLLANGTVKLADFGIARLQSGNATQTGQMFGTPKYMAPEQITGRPADARTDIFSLGVVLYQLATGAAPFDGETFSSIMFSVIQEPALSPSDIIGKVPKGFEYIISKSLAKKPENRYQNAAEMERDLRRLAMTDEMEPLPWSVGGIRSRADAQQAEAAAAAAAPPAPATPPTAPAPAPARPAARESDQTRILTVPAALAQAQAAAAPAAPTAPEAAAARPAKPPPADLPEPFDVQPAKAAPAVAAAAPTAAPAPAAPSPAPAAATGSSAPADALAALDAAVAHAPAAAPKPAPRAEPPAARSPEPAARPKGGRSRNAPTNEQPAARAAPSSMLKLGAAAAAVVAIAAFAAFFAKRGSSPAPEPAATPPAVATAPSTTPEPVASQAAASAAPQAVATVPPAAAVPAQAAASAPDAGAKETGTGNVALAVTPWGEVFVNGESKGLSPPLNELVLPAGEYDVVVKNGDLKPYEQKIIVKAGDRRRIFVKFE